MCAIDAGDGNASAAVNYCRDQYLNRRHPEQVWIGRGEKIARSSGSPDLTPLDFYLWSRVKSIGTRKKLQVPNIRKKESTHRLINDNNGTN